MGSTTKQSKGKAKARAPEQLPSANWLALQKKFTKTSKSTSKVPPKKRRKIESADNDATSEAGSSARDSARASDFPRGHDSEPIRTSGNVSPDKLVGTHGRESVDYLQKMVFGRITLTEEQKKPGKYLALDCEMVGVGPEGLENSLARVSLVNYHGAIILDEFVRQRERVVDYRTFVSGVRAEDMVNAITFTEVQKRVADLLKDRILVGHAVNNDLKALLLSHSRPLTRDTQLLAGKARLLKTKYPALRRLAQQELGITIQAGEHSSVTDARATMALYRLHRKEWEKGYHSVAAITTLSKSLGKRKTTSEDDDLDGSESEDLLSVSSGSKKTRKRKEKGTITGGGRRGISSGLSTIVRRGADRVKNGKIDSSSSTHGEVKEKWWSTLAGVGPSTSERRGSKGTMRISL